MDLSTILLIIAGNWFLIATLIIDSEDKGRFQKIQDHKIKCLDSN